MSETCPDCGRPIVESLQAFEAQWETHVEVCFPHVNFGGSELCAERTLESLRARLASAEAVIAAAKEMRTLAQQAGRMTEKLASIDALDEALEAYEAEKKR